VVVNIANDSVVENPAIEDVSVVLSNAAQTVGGQDCPGTVTILQNTAFGDIEDDDAPVDPCGEPTSKCAAADAAGGLLVQYKFDDPSDPWMDSGPNGIDATPVAGVSVDTLANGNKVIDMFPDGGVKFTPQILNCLSDSITVCWWSKSDQWWVPGNRYYHYHFPNDTYCIGYSTHLVNFVASDGLAIRGNPIYNCGTCSQGSCCTHWCSIAYAPGCCGSNGPLFGYLPTQAEYENWRLWAFVRSSSSFGVYINGVLKMSRAPSGTLDKCWNGESIFGNYSTGTPPFPGWIDDFRIYKRALSPAELAAMSASPPE
jgi:hypothetical protein